MLQLLALTLMVMLGWSTSVWAASGIVRYVNRTDAACGGHSPCSGTIQAAVDAAQAGDTIQIQAGTYVEQVTIAGKNSAATGEAKRIVIQADPAVPVGSVVLHGTVGQCRQGYAIRLQRSRFITIRGLTITGAGGEAIGLQGGHDQNAAIHIERNRILGNGSGSCNGGITIARGNPGTLIVNNLIHANGRNGVATVDADGGPHALVGNTIHGNGWNGVSVTRAPVVLLVNNAITGNGTAPGATGGRAGVRREATSVPLPLGIALWNNLLCGNRLGELSGPALDGTDGGNLTPTGSEGPGVRASLGCDDVGVVYANADGVDGLGDTADDDFSPAVGSPLIDRGRDPRPEWAPSLNPLFEADYAGPAVRPRAGTPGGPALFDIGAVEASLDTEAPGISFLEPLANAHVRQTVAVQVQATDTGSGVAGLTAAADGQSLAVTLDPTPPARLVTGTAGWSTTASPDGTHTLTATALDRSGQSASAQRLVIVDNTPPDTQIIGGPTGPVASSSATFTFTGTDNLSAASNLVFAWRLDGGAFTAFSSETTASVGGLGQGSHVFEVKARDQAGNEDPTPARQSLTLSSLQVTITEPAAGASVAAGPLIIRGTVAAGGAEAGVTVNGVVAAVQGSAFAAMVPVTAPLATLTAVATAASGDTSTQSITVAVTGLDEDVVTLRPSPPSGRAPLATSFSLLGGPRAARVELDLDGDGQVDFSGPTLDAEVFTYASPGLYFPSARVVDAQGNVLAARAIVQVVDPAGLEALLQAKWAALRDALSRSDIGAAVALFAEASRDALRDQLTALAGAGALGQVANDLGAIAMIQILDKAAEYELRAVRSGTMYSFHVLFVVDTDGVWRLRTF